MLHNISVKDALKLAYGKKAVLLDMRLEEEYKKGHLPTAVSVKEEAVRDYWFKEPDMIKILYCEYGNSSLKLARELSEEGYEAYSIVGGYRAYEGYVEKERDRIWTMEWKSNEPDQK